MTEFDEAVPKMSPEAAAARAREIENTLRGIIEEDELIAAGQAAVLAHYATSDNAKGKKEEPK